MQPLVLINKNYGRHQDDGTYAFKEAGGKTCYWPTQNGKGLGQCGMLNFLWRVGFSPRQLSIDQLSTPARDSVLFVDKIDQGDNTTYIALNQWMEQGGKIVATGELNAWQLFLPFDLQWKTHAFENPYAAIAYMLNGYEPQLIAPPQWSFIEYSGPLINHNNFVGKIAAVQGERQTPHRAHLQSYQKSPAVIKNNLFYYFNGHPFSAFQAWLQGQEDLSTWLGWRNRLFWLDEWVSFVFDLMIRLDIIKQAITRPGITGLNKTTVILRHDLDYSRDDTFLLEEQRRNITATHAVLKDRNTKYWLKKLKQYEGHEIAFHYNTGKKNWKELFHRLWDKKRRVSFLPHFKQVGRAGLLKQIKWAKESGLNIQTIHRHLCYLIYPEWIDAMDHVFESDSDVLGSNSLFRGHVLKWGIDQVEGGHGYLGDWPDAQFPIWFPFKLAHAGKGGRILKGWEMTALMEVEPHMLTQLLDSKIKHITQNVFTLIYHPAHANQPTFYKQGSLNYFKTILDIFLERDIDVLPMSKVFEKANQSFGN